VASPRKDSVPVQGAVVRIRIALIVGFAVLLAPTAALAARCLQYEPAKVAVSGVVFARTDWGPPGYGEDPAHDERERHLYVRLDRSLCVLRSYRDDPDDQTERNVRVMELTWAFGAFPKVQDRHVLMRGHLFHGYDGHHHTRVLLWVDRVRRLK